jgi:hypothetical protein
VGIREVDSASPRSARAGIRSQRQDFSENKFVSNLFTRKNFLPKGLV